MLNVEKNLLRFEINPSNLAQSRKWWETKVIGQGHCEDVTGVALLNRNNTEKLRSLHRIDDTAKCRFLSSLVSGGAM